MEIHRNLNVIDLALVLYFSAPRQCIICGKLASFECLSCFGDHGSGLDSTAFCDGCHERVHAHAKRRDHKPNPLNVPPVSQYFRLQSTLNLIASPRSSCSRHVLPNENHVSDVFWGLGTAMKLDLTFQVRTFSRYMREDLCR